MSTESNLKAHVFICTNKKEKGESCGAKNSPILFSNVKFHCKNNPDLYQNVRINQSGCLGRCQEGIVAVIYPQTKWIEHLKENDKDLLIEELSKVLR